MNMSKREWIAFWHKVNEEDALSNWHTHTHTATATATHTHTATHHSCLVDMQRKTQPYLSTYMNVTSWQWTSVCATVCVCCVCQCLCSVAFVLWSCWTENFIVTYTIPFAFHSLPLVCHNNRNVYAHTYTRTCQLGVICEIHVLQRYYKRCFCNFGAISVWKNWQHYYCRHKKSKQPKKKTLKK